MRPNFKKIPKELKNYNQWVCWAYNEYEEGKYTKVPMQPLKRYRASVHKPVDWTTYKVARDCYKENRNLFDGVGFVLSQSDPIVGWDLDKCVDRDTREIKPWAQEIIDKLDSYTEISPSGKGIRIFVKGKIIRNRRLLKLGIEIYKGPYFLTITGQHLDGLPRKVMDRTDVNARMYCRYAAGTTAEPLFLDYSKWK